MKKLLIIAATLAACNGTPAIKPPAKCASANSSTALSLADQTVTFYKDILPILSSQQTGKVYKCTTCHAHYAKPEGLNNVPELNRVVESMRNGRMPRVGTRVPEDSIKLFSAWQIQGFPAGEPANLSPKTQATGTPTSSSSTPQPNQNANDQTAATTCN